MDLLDRFGKWFQLKVYQIEVTFSVYMFTPAEKFIFWSIVFLLNSLTLIATILYMPQHIVFIANRAWFYIHGDSVDVIGLAKGALAATASSSSSPTGSTAAAIAAAAAAATTSSSLTTAAATILREL